MNSLETRLFNKMLQNQFRTTELGIKQKLVEVSMKTKNSGITEDSQTTSKEGFSENSETTTKVGELKKSKYLKETLNLERERLSLERQLDILV